MKMRLFLLLSIILAFSHLGAQQDSIPPNKEPDSLSIIRDGLEKLNLKKDSVGLITIKDYKIISFARDTIYLDTAQSISKEYQFNFLRRDDFELMPFSNVGQPYNRLARDFENKNFFPNIGASAKHFNYFEFYDINYYNVATPLSDLMFKTTFEQGQLLDALLTLNTSQRMNISLAFKGFRSLGKYRLDQAESGNFRTTFNFRTKNNRYSIRGHFASQDLMSEENGGISDRTQFENGEDEFLDRSRIDIAIEDANSRILGKRYFLEQWFKLFGDRKDSVKTRSTNITMGHQFNYETRFYQFEQEDPDTFFGTEAFEDPIADRARLKTLFNQLSMTFSNKTLGAVTGKVGFYGYDYFFNSILIDENGAIIPNQLSGNEITLGGDYSNMIGKLHLSGGFNYTLSGKLSGNGFNASLGYALNDGNKVYFGIRSSSRLPNFNYLLYQSDYRNFNWQNGFEKQNVQTGLARLESKWIGTVSAEYNMIDNYSYFAISGSAAEIEEAFTNGSENSLVRPLQEPGTINYLKVKYEKEFKWRRWALNNTVMYQNVGQDNEVLNVPQLITRNSLYFSKHIFKKAMFVQTGVTFKYFTNYNMDAYNPLLGEFYVQNREEFGGFPLLDFFINAKVRQTRIFLKAEHLNTLWSKKYNYYSAPNYPYRDFVIRFGLVWNFFS